jgi:hypothetical protein
LQDAGRIFKDDELILKDEHLIFIELRQVSVGKSRLTAVLSGFLKQKAGNRLSFRKLNPNLLGNHFLCAWYNAAV